MGCVHEEVAAEEEVGGLAVTKPTYLYLLAGDDWQKVGISGGRSMVGRFRTIQTSSPSRLDFSDAWLLPDRQTALDVERGVLDCFEDIKAGEWLRCTRREAYFGIHWVLRKMGFDPEAISLCESGRIEGADMLDLRLWSTRYSPEGRAIVLQNEETRKAMVET